MAWDNEWHQYIRKDGKPGHWYCVPGPEYTPLNTCDICGLLGTPRRVRLRSDVWSWMQDHPKDWANGGKNNCLCTGCWNRARAIVNRRDAIKQNAKTVRKLLRTIQHERKNQNHG